VQTKIVSGASNTRAAMKPYSLDIRTKVCEAYLRGEGSQRALAARFDVSLSFVRDLIRLQRETGSITPRTNHANNHHKTKLDPETLEFVLRLMDQQPRPSLSQLCSRLADERNVHVSRATLWRAIRRCLPLDHDLRKPRRSLHNPLTIDSHQTNSQAIERRGELM